MGTHGDLRHNSRGRFSVEVKKKIRRSARPKCISQACDGSTKSPGLYDIAVSPLLSFSHHPEMRLAGRKMYPILICFFLACWEDSWWQQAGWDRKWEEQFCWVLPDLQDPGLIYITVAECLGLFSFRCARRWYKTYWWFHGYHQSYCLTTANIQLLVKDCYRQDQGKNYSCKQYCTCPKQTTARVVA